MSNRIYDGFTTMIGQDGFTDPSDLTPSFCSEAVNRTFRGGKNLTRPAFMGIKYVFENTEDEEVVSKGNFQGAIPYSAVLPGIPDGWVMSHAGILFYVELVGSVGYVKRIFSGFDPRLLHVWFCQAVERVYAQNGLNNPVMWNGTPTNQATILNPLNGEMPIGTFMAYCHGRVHLVTADDFILSSDNIYSNGFTDTSATKNFTEFEYWANGGAFGAPLEMGEATGITVLPTININDSGQGELVVFYRNGAMTLNVSLNPRSLWTANQINRVGMIGRGCVSPWSVCRVNGDVVFRSDDGWAFYSNAQAQTSQAFPFRKFSSEENIYTDFDTEYLKQFASAIYFDNRIISTVSPFTSVNENKSWGFHRAHRGMIVVDLDQTTPNSPDSGLTFRWNGLWNGIRPCQLITARIRSQERAFAFSFDSDGINRVYEITKDSGYDVTSEMTNVPIRSAVIPKRFNFGNQKDKKQLSGGFIQFSKVQSPFSVDVKYRPDHLSCWIDLSSKSFECDPCSGEKCELENSFDIYKTHTFTTPKRQCLPGTGNSDIAIEFQPRIEMVGDVKIDRFALACEEKMILLDPVGDCNDKRNTCDSIPCCPDDFLTGFYSIK